MRFGADRTDYFVVCRSVSGFALMMIAVGGCCGWRAIRLATVNDSNDAEYLFREWGRAVPQRANPDQLDRVLQLNPRFSAAWIARGLEEESMGNRSQAEISLLRATEIDHLYQPRWTLANFYLRGGNPEKFWAWARRGLEMAYDPAPLFALCWSASNDAQEIFDRAIPNQPQIRRHYLDFLVKTKRLDAARPLAVLVSKAAGSSDLRLLLDYCDAEIEHGRVEAALEVWNSLATRAEIPYQSLDPASGRSLTNGDLTAEPLQRGFDWRPARVEDAALVFATAAREWALSLGGRQPEICDFVEQYTPVIAGAHYRLRYLYRSSNLPKETGLGFSLLDARTASEFASGDAEAAEALREGAVAFTSPAGCDMIRIVLRYRRPRGVLRTEGSAVFRNIRLEKLE